MLMSCIAFDAAIVESLAGKAKGEALAVTGRGKLTSWSINGATKHGMSVVAERVLSAYQVRQRRKRAGDESERDA